ncbi:hypothetical protein JMA_19360 [Jeotgalibacillus malaysiensis]|uniref:Uncharacterized protein n=1 Tax=Jeotgalibacillus malaysiensis TaxID=1508404 RepID=A0A0B5ARR0_9BACL|nr:hypothetical protein [Jeotgalibacillus malaysiensis]AJD91253.1 hypothetical protein JMA_19360 [Jeotgalibacillus malaysiensis]
MENEYHVCATCIYFKALRNEKGNMYYTCERLGYETKPHYRFNCWTPKEHVIKLMKKRRG